MSKKLDVLKRQDFINKLTLLVETLSDKKKNCCFGVDGAWGSGKTFVLEKFEEQLKEVQSEETADNRYFVFHYDCWRYDYYEEPTIAIVAAMMDIIEKELSWFSEGVENVKRLAFETVKTTLLKIAGELFERKIGFDFVEVAGEILEENDKVDDKEFDSLYGFKKALEKVREGIKEIAERKTIIFVVDELDRCLPEYAIKVLERLHHIFVDIDNVIVIISMDKKQLSHSIKEIYGDIEVDTYLRKFISFKVKLNLGMARNYFGKYSSYVSMFEFTDLEKEEIEGFFADIMHGLDIRTQERIFNKAEVIHRLIKDDEIKDCSIMTFEVLYLTSTLVLRNHNLRWLIDKGETTNNTLEEKSNYHEKIIRYEAEVSKNGYRHNGRYSVQERWQEKTIFWLASLYGRYRNGGCGYYYYDRPVKKEIELIKRFSQFVKIVDED